MKYNLSKAAYERRCYQVAYHLNSSFDIFGNVAEMYGLSINGDYNDLEDFWMLIDHILTSIYGIPCVENAMEGTRYDFFDDILREVSEPAYNSSVKDFVLKTDEVICDLRESQIAQEIKENGDEAVDLKELDEIYVPYLGRRDIEPIDNYHEPIDALDNYYRYRNFPKTPKEFYKKLIEENISLIMKRIKYKEKHDGKKTEAEKLYDNSVFLLQLRLMMERTLNYLKPDRMLRRERHLVELFEKDPVVNNLNSKVLAIKKFEREFLWFKDVYEGYIDKMEINEAIDILKSWIDEEIVDHDEKIYDEFYKKRNEVLEYAIEKLEESNK